MVCGSPRTVPKNDSFVERDFEHKQRESNYPQQDGLRPDTVKVYSESLILAQNERWRQASYMQVERLVPRKGC